MKAKKTVSKAVKAVKEVVKKATAPKVAKKVVVKKEEKVHAVVITPAERAVPDVKGRVFEGKKLRKAYWRGKALVLRTVEETEFTLHGKLLADFLS